MALSDSEIELYSRQILIPAMGGRAQARLASSRVRIVGKSIGCAYAASYLAGAGIGQIECLPGLKRADAAWALAPLWQRRPGSSFLHEIAARGALVPLDVLLVDLGFAADNAGGLPFAPPGMAEIDSIEALSRDVELAMRFAAPGTAGIDPITVLPRQVAGVGEIGLLSGPKPALLLLPTGSGWCLACCTAPPLDSTEGLGEAWPATDVVGAALLGTMAALATLNWLAQLVAEPAAGWLRPLAESDYTSPEALPPRREPCPRCASPG